MTYLLLKWLHVLAAIIAVGANATYGVWLARASRTPAVLPFTLRVIKTIDDRIANPSYGLLLLTGGAMAANVPNIWRMPWMIVSLIAYALIAIVGLGVYTPTLKRQIEALDRDGFDSPAYQALNSRSRTLGIVLSILTMTVVFMMVVKPRLWAQ